MTDDADTPAVPDGAPASQLPALRREAVTPRERRGNVGTVALLCSLAGVASGFALATTLVAAQLAHEPRARTSACRAMIIESGPRYLDVASPTLLGILYVNGPDGAATVKQVAPGTAAEAVGLQPGDVVRQAAGEIIDRPGELQAIVRSQAVGSQLPLVVEREGATLELRPVLGSYRAAGLVPSSSHFRHR
ncbi:MAG: PDZ domain-containing protein [Kofleriaceae bacterium]